MGLAIATAGRLGVPLAMVSSDDKGCAEAATHVPSVKQAITKYGKGRYMAHLLHPSVTGPAIEEAAYQGTSEFTRPLDHRPARVRFDLKSTEPRTRIGR